MKKRRVLLHQPLQAAFAESRARTPIVNEIQKIAALVTDGLIGYSIQIDSVHDTLEQARAVCPEDEEDFYIASKPVAREEAPAPTESTLTTMRRFPSNDDPSSLSLPTEAAPRLSRDEA